MCVAAVLPAREPWVIALMSVPLRPCLVLCQTCKLITQKLYLARWSNFKLMSSNSKMMVAN